MKISRETINGVCLAIATVMVIVRTIWSVYFESMGFFEAPGLLLLFIVLTIPLVSSLSPLVFIAGGTLILEMVGIFTGLPFGTYEYGDDVVWLGLLGVPFFIPFAWYVLLASCASILKNRWLVVITIVLIDGVLEEFALVQGYWFWEHSGFFIAPIQNYLSWGVLAYFAFPLLVSQGVPKYRAMGALSVVLGYMSASFLLSEQYLLGVITILILVGLYLGLIVTYKKQLSK